MRALGRAAETAVAEPEDRSFLERRLSAAFAAALETEFPGLNVVVNKKLAGFELPGWDPSPGWFDVAVVDSAGQPIVVAELKLDDVDQTLWDIFKVASALEVPSVEAAYVVAAAPQPVWGSALEAVELFAGDGEREWYSRFFFVEWPRAWERLLRGGRGRPTRVRRVLLLDLALRVPVANYPPYELRALRVAKGSGWLPISDGWPPRKVDRGEIPDEELTAAALPAEHGGEGPLHEFALTTNGYERMGSFKRCAALANAALDAWRRTGELPATLRELRCCLFFEQRRWHHYGYGFDAETMRYARALVSAIRALVSSPPADYDGEPEG